MNDLHKAMYAGLTRLMRVAEKKEINMAIYPPNYKSPTGEIVSDVPFLIAVDTPDASQIVFDPNSDRYDAWSNDGAKLLTGNLSLAKAAKLVTTEYFWAKATRVKAHHPDADINEIMAELERGYQNKKPVVMLGDG